MTRNSCLLQYTRYTEAMNLQVLQPHTKTIKTLTILFWAFVVLMVLVLGAAAVRHYQDKENKKTQQSTAPLVAANEQVTALEARNQQLEQAYQNERVNCEKGKALYDLALTTTQKRLVKSTAVPTCGRPVL